MSKILDRYTEDLNVILKSEKDIQNLITDRQALV